MTRSAQWLGLWIVATTLVLTGCGGGGIGNFMIIPTVVTVSPTQAAVAATTQTQQFTAAVTGNSNQSVTWSVDTIAGGNSTVGTISANGLYTPPPPPGGTHTVT